MRNSLPGVALAFAMVLNYSALAKAQTKKASKSPAPASSFDPHDLSGVWMQDRPRPGKVVERFCEDLNSFQNIENQETAPAK